MRDKRLMVSKVKELGLRVKDWAFLGVEMRNGMRYFMAVFRSLMKEVKL